MTKPIQYYYAELPNRRVGYTSTTTFFVQVGWRNSGYRTKHKVVGDLEKAFEHYEAVRLSSNGKKRILMSGAKQPVIARQAG